MSVTVKRAGNRGYWHASWRKLRRNPLTMFALVLFMGLTLASVFAPLIAPYDPLKQNYTELRKPPSVAYPFGTDDIGRDVFSRVIWGGRESLPVAFIAVGMGVVGGVVIGLISGYYGGLLDTVIQRVLEIIMAFPTVLLLLAIVAALGPNLATVMIAIGFSSIPGYARLVRASVLSAKNMDYITASRALGAADRAIMFRHILPNVIAPIIIYGTLGLGNAILVTAGLSFIGLGAQPPSPEWGSMLLYGRQFLRQAWWMSVFPGLAVFIAVLCINLLGDGLRDALDPKHSG